MKRLTSLFLGLSLTGCATVFNPPETTRETGPPRVVWPTPTLVQYPQSFIDQAALEAATLPKSGAVARLLDDYIILRHQVCVIDDWHQITCKIIKAKRDETVSMPAMRPTVDQSGHGKKEE